MTRSSNTSRIPANTRKTIASDQSNKQDLKQGRENVIQTLKSEIEQKKQRLQELRMERMKKEGISMQSVNEIVKSLLAIPFSENNQSTQTDPNMVCTTELSVTRVSQITITSEDQVFKYEKGVQTDLLPVEDVAEPPKDQANLPIAAEVIETPAAQTLDPEPLIKKLSEEDKEFILESNEFFLFMDKASTIVERCLASKYDIFKDYALVDSKQEKLHSQKFNGGTSAVISIGWSSRHKELLMVGHSNACNMWNIYMEARPEQQYTAPLEITHISCHPFGDTIIGGLLDGNICIWDPRCKPSPVLKSARPIVTSSLGHDFAIRALKLVGQRNAHVLMTSSEDKICGWDLTMLAQPTEEIVVDNTSMSFLQDTSRFYVGRGDGKLAAVNRLYYLTRFDRPDVKKGIDNNCTLRAHDGYISKIDGLNGHLISGSFDWTVKLWSLKVFLFHKEQRNYTLKDN